MESVIHPPLRDHSYRILTVDDNPLATELIQISLEEIGHYKVLQINDPNSAVIAALDFEPDLVVMDVQMPHLDGRAAALLIQSEERLKDIPILFVTSMIPEESDDVQNPFGWFGPLQKPVSPRRLARVVESILKHGTIEAPAA